MEKSLSIPLPAGAEYILNTLHQAGFEAYIVGGCVRDSLLNRTPVDWDITTSARPEEVKKLFRRTINTGLQHGSVTVMQKEEAFDVTTYRCDGFYSDGRHPDSVNFISSLAEDLARRDFTINAMAYAPEIGVIDLYNGLQDLENKTIRAVGDPGERFTEDALRMLRAVRFSAQLGFEIEAETFAAIRLLAPRLELISKERIRDEINKLLLSDHPEYFEKLHACGITAVIMPRFDEMLATAQHSKYHLYDVGHHTLKVMAATPARLPLRLAALLHDTGKVPARVTDAAGGDHFKGHQILSADYAEKFLKEFRYDNKTADYVLRLIRVHDIRIAPTPANLRRLLDKIGKDLFPDYLEFSLADSQGKAELSRREFAPHYEKTVETYQQVLENGDPVSQGDLAVSGKDLVAAGVKPGPAMGLILRHILEDVQRDPSHNTRDHWMDYLTETLPDPKDAYFQALELIRAHDIIILHSPLPGTGGDVLSLEYLKHLIRDNYPEKSVYLTGGKSEQRIPGIPHRPAQLSDRLFPFALCILADCQSPEGVLDPRWQNGGDILRFDHQGLPWHQKPLEVHKPGFSTCRALLKDFTERCGLIMTPSTRDLLET